MHKLSFRIAGLCLIYLISVPTVANGNVFKWIRVGRLHNKIVDSGDQGESAGEGTFLYYYYDSFDRPKFDHAGYQLGAKVGGNIVISGAGHGNSNELELTMPIGDENGITIKKYLRYPPPKITVNGDRLDAPYPLPDTKESDLVDTDHTIIPGTADAMVESRFKTNLGLEVHQRVLGWSQQNHDDYLLYEWTFTNTGDIDLDDDIEPAQTVTDFYFFRAINWLTGSGRNWNSAYGMTPGDSLRLHFAYPQRSQSASEDDLGNPRSSGWLRRPTYIGEAILHADTKPGQEGTRDRTDDITQPRTSGYHTAENTFWKMNATLTSPTDHAKLYEVMSEGLGGVFTMTEIDPALTTYSESHHVVPMDETKIKFVRLFTWWNWRAVSVYVLGPYTFEPGDSLTIAYAMVAGGFDPDTGFRVGKAWNAGTAGDLWGGPPWKLEQPHLDFDDLSPTENDKGKASFIFSQRDSLFANAYAAQWAYRNNYNVPPAPPSPDLTVTGLPGEITIEWSDVSAITMGKPIDGYRIYRSLGSTDTGFVKIFDTADAGQIVYTWPDVTAAPGQGYYYFVTAYDDGSNDPGVLDVSEVLESSWHQNRTTLPAARTRAPVVDDLSKIRVVPNPFNISAPTLQWIGEPDKILFVNLPGECTIKIYSESGDLIRTLIHDDDSGDEAWGVLAEEHSASDYGQIIVSGLYIAYIETPAGDSHYVKFVVVR